MTKKKNSTSRKKRSAPKKSAKSLKKKSLIVNKNFPIVAIGASAGGLEAISELLENLPPDTGMAFVIIQHLDPTHESRIDEILARKTLMPVAEIKNNVHVESNHVYVIPPNTSLGILHGLFKLLPRVTRKGIHLPIDSFFNSLAKDQESKCIGIILSGTASDGTQGLGMIKSEGGLTIAQDPRSAKYDGMSLSAIAAGVVDLVLTPKQMGEELVRISRHPNIISKKQDLISSIRVSPPNEVEENVNKILLLLKKNCHVDFSNYKRSTLNRRISRRMVLLKKKNIKDYLDYLETRTDEVQCLFEDILINVTEFFRDPKAYAALKTKIFPEIMKNKADNSPIRIWVVGCATGEEAYSVAISLLEFLGKTQPPIQIFATDISELAIQKARAGIYHESISKNVSKKQLQMFFVKTETGYRIKSYIREMCLFSWHDISSDPPFAKLDLISCRNLLIYFDQALQEHVLRIFHYALKQSGFLWLGSSESVGKLPSLFNLVDKKSKFYSRKSSSVTPQFHFPANAYIPEKLEIAKRISEQSYSPTDIAHETDRIAALKYAPPGVVVNNAMEIILIRGEIGPFFQLTHGQASFNLFKMARPELASDLRMAIGIAKKNNAVTRKEGFILPVGGQLKTFAIDIIPFTCTMASQIKEQYFLISFDLTGSARIEDVSSFTAPTKSSRQHIESKDRHIKELDQELSDSKAYQKSLIQDFEITQEELTSANEELQSTIEELQSTNEELETAKEELQSTNEELTTVNDELQSRNIDLAKLNDDLINLLGCVDIPIVMVGFDGSIRRFTPKAGKLLNLIPSDVGRPISNINPNFEKLDLGSLVSEVIETIAIKEMNIQDHKGRWFRLQVRPYKTIENKIEGAVIALVDINLLTQNLIESKVSLDYATSVANTVHLPLVVLDKQLRLKSANHAFFEKFQASMDDEGSDLLTLIGTVNIAQVRQTLNDTFVSNVELKDFEVEYKLPSSQPGSMLFNGRRIQWIDEDEPNALLLCIQDITDRIKMEKSLKEAIAVSKRANQSKDIFLATLSHELRTPLTAILCWSQLLLNIEEGSEKLKHGLKAIEQNSKIQGQLIDDLLDVTRIQSGKLVLNIARMDPCDVVHKAVESVRQLAESKSVTIKTHVKPLNGNVAADAARLQQILWNLLINAIKFSPPKKIINVRISPVLEQGQSFAAIEVIDHGKGIKPDFLPQLFERFTQADSTTTRLHGGLGLGLTIANDLMKLLGGSIRAKSEGEGKGAVFTVLLPLIPTTEKLVVKKPFKEIVPNKETAPWQSLHGLCVLIVEDEQNSLDVFTELLKSAGAKTISVTSAADAMIALDNHQPDILISDIAMPGEDGISLIQSIRARGTKQGGQIPAVALTAYAAKEDINRALLAGFNAHLVKPFNAMDLIVCVANLVAGR